MVVMLKKKKSWQDQVKERRVHFDSRFQGIGFFMLWQLG